MDRGELSLSHKDYHAYSR